MKTALILTDFSDAANHAAEYLVYNAENLGLKKVIVLNTVPPVTSIPKSPMIVRDQDDEVIDSRKILERLTSSLKSQLSNQIELETHVREMLIGEELNDLVAEWAIDVIIMGMAGKSKAEQTIIGSNTIRVLKIAEVPILVVPGDTPIKTVDKIVYTLDTKEQGVSIHETILHDILNSTKAQLTYLSVGKQDREAAPADISITYIQGENVVKSILSYAEEKNISLIINAPRNRGLFEELFHSSVTKKLAYTSKIPLLLVKERAS